MYSKVRNYLVRLIKKLDRLTHYRCGSFIRRITNPNTASYWNNFYSKFDTFYRDFPYAFLVEFLPKDKDFSLLDIGCGMGDGCQFLKKHFSSACIEGADLSPLAIRKAKEKDPSITYFVLDIRKENPPHIYDFISLVHTLEHFNDPFPILEKCLKFVRKAVLIVVPYVREFDSPYLYSPGEHRYLFNENSFSQYKGRLLKITEYIPSKKYNNMVYMVEP